MSAEARFELKQSKHGDASYIVDTVEGLAYGFWGNFADNDAALLAMANDTPALFSAVFPNARPLAEVEAEFV